MSGLRYIGVVMLPLCGWLAGDAYSQRSVTHSRELQAAIVLLQRIQQEIVFRRTDLATLCRVLCEEGVLKGQKNLTSLQEIVPPGSFSKEEQQCFAECMKGLGKTCAAQEQKRLDYYLARLVSFQERAKRSADAQAGLPYKLGFAAGAVLALVFL